MKTNLKLVTPDLVNRAVGPVRMTNGAYRAREHLTPSEVEQLIEAAKTNRYGHRDATMVGAGPGAGRAIGAAAPGS